MSKKRLAISMIEEIIEEYHDIKDSMGPSAEQYTLGRIGNVLDALEMEEKLSSQRVKDHGVSARIV